MKFLSGNSISTKKELYSCMVLLLSPSDGRRKRALSWPTFTCGNLPGGEEGAQRGHQGRVTEIRVTGKRSPIYLSAFPPEVFSVLLLVMDDRAQPLHCQKLMRTPRGLGQETRSRDVPGASEAINQIYIRGISES